MKSREILPLENRLSEQLYHKYSAQLNNQDLTGNEKKLLLYHNALNTAEEEIEVLNDFHNVLETYIKDLIIENQALKHSIELNHGKDCIIEIRDAVENLKKDVEQFPNYLENKYGHIQWNNEFPDLDMLLLYESGGDMSTFVYKILNYPSYALFSQHKQLFDKKHSKDYIVYKCKKCGFSGNNMLFAVGDNVCINCSTGTSINDPNSF